MARRFDAAWLVSEIPALTAGDIRDKDKHQFGHPFQEGISVLIYLKLDTELALCDRCLIFWNAYWSYWFYWLITQTMQIKGVRFCSIGRFLSKNLDTLLIESIDISIDKGLCRILLVDRTNFDLLCSYIDKLLSDEQGLLSYS